MSEDLKMLRNKEISIRVFPPFGDGLAREYTYNLKNRMEWGQARNTNAAYIHNSVNDNVVLAVLEPDSRGSMEQ